MVRRIDNLKKEEKPVSGFFAHARFERNAIRNCSVLRDRFLEEAFVLLRRICVEEELVFRCESAFADEQRKAALCVQRSMTFVEEVLLCGRGRTI